MILRIALALSFIYPPIAAYFDPFSWVGYFPLFLTNMVDGMMLLAYFGTFEILLALWILFGKRVALPSAIAAITLLAIIVVNPTQIDILFRDISILLIALVLIQKERA